MKYITLIGGGVLPVTEEQAFKILNLKNQGNKNMVELDNNFISLTSIAGILDEPTMETIIETSMGIWRCKFGFYHTKYQSCRDNLNRQINGMERYELIRLPKAMAIKKLEEK